MLELRNITKRYDEKIVLNNLSLCLKEGVVTGFLGPNGAGKTTTMRSILGLVTPTSGTVIINGRSYQELEYPLKEIGVLINANAIDERLTPFQYLQIMAVASDIEKDKIQETLSFVGLYDVKDKKVKTFSLGMKQRLGIAGAILGDPNIILLDEPFNGLDVDGIHWLRGLIRKFAEKGKAVLVSSHLLSEVQEVADRIIVIAQRNLIADMDMEEMKKKSLRSYALARSSDNNILKKQLIENGAEIRENEKGYINVYKLTTDQIGEIAHRNNICVYELTKHKPSLEQIYLELVADKVDYQGIYQKEDR
ncbi:ATP-binding cassette domain-containing protein [Tissierella sp. Yu-01]|uniref:ABC transporter ATP-binding protein n=1 Tax=Tissierella sp. Yu-01 TaxID=3035694 RepID=UPI00240DA5A4|nr:ATP-binding cassette domain-containing protein [Tissierella sp. Yu-01]WFA09297.1 ATP-binding cassette domain-containing protein [Tissierella sp. Yu-01]